MKKKILVSSLLISTALVLGGVIAYMHPWSRTKQELIINDYHNELFGDNVYIFSPQDNPDDVNTIINDIYKVQEGNQFGNSRYSFLFLPGLYDEKIDVNVGFYTQVSGLGILPTDIEIQSLNCYARWLGNDPSNHNACCNFWRGLENITINSDTTWAVSQATDIRRIQVNGSLHLHDNYGWCSGGFLSDSKITNLADSGTQQQWLSRNSEWKNWIGENWNLVFVGLKEGSAPSGTWPEKPFTNVVNTKIIREKPFIVATDNGSFGIMVPKVMENSTGTSWEDIYTYNTVNSQEEIDPDSNCLLPIDAFFVAKPENTVEEINAALSEGKGIILTPGIYKYSEPIHVTRKNSIILGMGLATLNNTSENEALIIEDNDGVIVSGILFDAGYKNAESLIHVKGGQEKNVPIVLSDIYCRIGGAVTSEPCKVKACMIIDADDVIGDNFWLWRADHGTEVGWDLNTCDNGLIVNGNNVTMYALMAEHFNKYQVIWNGNNGSVFMYQSEIPYDVPNQEVWMSHDGSVEGYSSFYVDDRVDTFDAYGLGIYLYNRDALIVLNSAMEAPKKPGINITNICTVMLNGYPGMRHIINDEGKSVHKISQRQIITKY